MTSNARGIKVRRAVWHADDLSRRVAPALGPSGSKPLRLLLLVRIGGSALLPLVGLALSSPLPVCAERLSIPLHEQEAGTVEAALAARFSRSEGHYFLGESRISKSYDADQQGLELRARYWPLRGIGVGVAAGRPDPQSDFGLAEDWSTDRLRVEALLIRRLHPFMVRASASSSVAVRGNASGADRLGVGAGICFSLLAGAHLEAFGTATAGNPGNRGTHGSLGVGMAFFWTRLSLVGDYWWGHTRKRGSIAEHELQGGGMSAAYAMGYHWAAYLSLGGWQTSPYTIAADVVLDTYDFNVVVGARFLVDGRNGWTRLSRPSSGSLTDFMPDVGL